ncbi:MAG: DoxX family protein [Lewinellaceae bacterium]|nr:DoxX family protein [Lewinellaceae bacterium]
MAKILNSVFIIFAVYMGIKQGWAMFSAKPEMIDMFDRWQFGKTGVQTMGAITMLSALLILLPASFLWGNFLMAAGILLIICFHLWHNDLKGVIVELPFFLLNLVIIYLQHPLDRS